ncbi:MAG: S46 family peptidase [Bryobacteraceae bacterium]
MSRLFLALILAAGALFAGEGKWTPRQILELDRAWLKQQGLELPPGKLWDPARGTGLLAAAVNIGGCSAAFISDTGLIITNHHCLFSVVQEHSTPQNDIIAKGFLARSLSEELPSKTTRVTVPRAFTDVTAEILAAVPANADDLERFNAIEAKQKQCVAACEKRPATRCQVAAFDGGMQYVLVETAELADIRLVYAPPRSIGEYGGDVDNWMWPRHTGDFAIARAYVNGAPYRPEFHFPVAKQPLAPGDFVMVLGYPGLTYRALTAAEMAERRDLFFPRRIDLFGEWIRILEESTANSPGGAIAVASNVKSLRNVYKNAQGQLAGFARGRILEKQRAAEDAVLQWAAGQPKHRGALAAREGLLALVNEQRATWERDFLLTAIPAGPKSLYLGTTLVRAANERQKPDAGRDPDYMERNLPRLGERLAREQKNYYAPADKALFESFVRRALALPPGQRIEAIDRHFRGAADPQAIRARIDALYAGTAVLALDERQKMFTESPDALRARRDPVLDLAFELDRELQDLKQRRDRWQGTVSRLRPQWRAAVIAHAGRPVAPDANGTLRVSLAHVKGYAPRDAVVYQPQTTLSGVLEKHTGEDPFDVPESIRAAARGRRFGQWLDPRLKDVPVNFLADGDTTGGNSGSPVVNGRGELVGVNFDRVWENVANDFGYNPDIARNVSVDVRYMLWILDQVENADALLKELGVRR